MQQNVFYDNPFEIAESHNRLISHLIWFKTQKSPLKIVMNNIKLQISKKSLHKKTTRKISQRKCRNQQIRKKKIECSLRKKKRKI